MEESLTKVEKYLSNSQETLSSSSTKMAEEKNALNNEKDDHVKEAKA